MITKLVIAVVVALAGLLGFAATRPDTFRIQRAVCINAPPDKIFALIADFHGWAAWSPWERLDPALRRTFSGAVSGRGAVYEWDGNGQVGAGRMEIVEASAPSRVTIKLDFIRPFAGHNTAEFTLDPRGSATDVTWAMTGRNTYVAKLMGVFVSIDRMVGTYFETGLANLKAATERP
jgi:uncharacterized protein YndB with AHSA1/START domain